MALAPSLGRLLGLTISPDHIPMFVTLLIANAHPDVAGRPENFE
jgi:hypothetical protein